MPLQPINLGAEADDGTGDDLRTGGGKINAMFAELYAALGGGDFYVAPLQWDYNFTAPGEFYIRAAVDMVIEEVAVTNPGNGTLSYEMSTGLAPDTFAPAESPFALAQGAKLKGIATDLTGQIVSHLAATSIGGYNVGLNAGAAPAPEYPIANHLVFTESAYTGPSGGTSIVLPPEVDEGDVVIAIVVSATTLLATRGVKNQGYTDIIAANDVGVNGVGVQAVYKIMGSSPDGDVDFTAHTTANTACMVVVLRGVDLAAPFAGISAPASGLNTTPDIPAFTPDAAPCIRLGLIGIDTVGVSAPPPPDGWELMLRTIAGPESNPTSTGLVTFKVTAAATEEDPASVVVSATEEWAAWQFAFKLA